MRNNASYLFFITNKKQRKNYGGYDNLNPQFSACKANAVPLIRRSKNCCQCISRFSAGLLQLTVLWSFQNQHQQTATYSEYDNIMPTHCCRSCIGCRWNNASCTSWPYWPTRNDRPQCQSIWAATLRHAAARGHCDRHQLHYCKFLSDERLSANVP